MGVHEVVCSRPQFLQPIPGMIHSSMGAMSPAFSGKTRREGKGNVMVITTSIPGTLKTLRTDPSRIKVRGQLGQGQGSPLMVVGRNHTVSQEINLSFPPASPLLPSTEGSVDQGCWVAFAPPSRMLPGCRLGREFRNRTSISDELRLCPGGNAFEK